MKCVIRGAVIGIVLSVFAPNAPLWAFALGAMVIILAVISTEGMQ